MMLNTDSRTQFLCIRSPLELLRSDGGTDDDDDDDEVDVDQTF